MKSRVAKALHFPGNYSQNKTEFINFLPKLAHVQTMIDYDFLPERIRKIMFNISIKKHPKLDDEAFLNLISILADRKETELRKLEKGVNELKKHKVVDYQMRILDNALIIIENRGSIRKHENKLTEELASIAPIASTSSTAPIASTSSTSSLRTLTSSTNDYMSESDSSMNLSSGKDFNHLSKLVAPNISESKKVSMDLMKSQTEETKEKGLGKGMEKKVNNLILNLNN
ncbi:hypothetical protein OAC51_09215 [Flavobacteriaceae bacterium]|nr:hypothetical protein [Flavobacteriaceae bacterium]